MIARSFSAGRWYDLPVNNPNEFDVAVVGGGPAGLSASLVLGRARRRVLLADKGGGRNERASTVNGFFTRDGTPPADLRRVGAEQLAPYAVSVRRAGVVGVRRSGAAFHIDLDDGSAATARRVILATGMRDFLPDIDGFDAVYGTSAHHCPYCDGWEWRDAAAAVYATDGAAEYALGLTSWTSDVVLLTDGVAVDGRRVSALRSVGGRLRSIEFAEGPPLDRSAFFFHLGMAQASGLPAAAGCALDGDGFVAVGDSCETTVPGVYAAGDCTPGPQSVALAVAEGAKAAAAAHQDLRREDTG